MQNVLLKFCVSQRAKMKILRWWQKWTYLSPLKLSKYWMLTHRSVPLKFVCCLPLVHKHNLFSDMIVITLFSIGNNDGQCLADHLLHRRHRQHCSSDGTKAHVSDLIRGALWMFGLYQRWEEPVQNDLLCLWIRGCKYCHSFLVYALVWHIYSNLRSLPCCCQLG